MTVPEHTTILAVERGRAISALVSDALVAWRREHEAGAGGNGTGSREGEAGAPRYEVHRADTLAGAVSAIGIVRPDVVVVAAELAFDGGAAGRGSTLFDAVRECVEPPKVVVVADRDDRALAAEAIGLGAFDYCVGPVRADELAVVLQRASHIRELEVGMDDLPGRLAGVERFGNLVGSCDAMRSVFSAAQMVAGADAGVLLVGESGTGKLLIARAIHHLSARRDGPFVVANPAGASPEVMEQVVFGSAPVGGGDGTGRIAGLLEQADGGTLLLEGVCCLPLSLQTRLSDFLRERSPHPDVRVIATTERPPRCGLHAPAVEGSPALREDLYYRLGVVTIELPPLRDRGEDIAIMARALLARYSAEHGRTVYGFSRAATGAMMSHGWPGNIAELEARVRRAVILSRGKLVSAADLGLNGNGRPGEVSLAEARSTLERSMVTDALLQAAGNVSMAARSIGVSRPTMYDLIRKHELDLSEYKGLGGS